jgi:hypothetical protein
MCHIPVTEIEANRPNRLCSITFDHFVGECAPLHTGDPSISLARRRTRGFTSNGGPRHLRAPGWTTAFGSKAARSKPSTSTGSLRKSRRSSASTQTPRSWSSCGAGVRAPIGCSGPRAAPRPGRSSHPRHRRRERQERARARARRVRSRRSRDDARVLPDAAQGCPQGTSPARSDPGQDLAKATRGLPFSLVSDESVHACEKQHQPAEGWPPTSWFESWSRGFNRYAVKRGLPPMDLRWLHYRKVASRK